ncbi:MAG: hypothetical protein NVS3B20_23030 [Polyangiales bacterium]
MSGTCAILPILFIDGKRREQLVVIHAFDLDRDAQRQVERTTPNGQQRATSDRVGDAPVRREKRHQRR